MWVQTCGAQAAGPIPEDGCLKACCAVPQASRIKKPYTSSSHTCLEELLETKHSPRKRTALAVEGQADSKWMIRGQVPGHYCLKSPEKYLMTSHESVSKA
eukprot:5602402-Amphidinium_carterae.1